jgi:bifunctional DNase/RNase
MKLVELKIIGLSYSQTQVGSYVLVLSEKRGKKKLPIIINQEYAQYIALKIEKMKTKRPFTHDLFQTITDKLGADLYQVKITHILEGIFYAKLVYHNMIDEFEVDCVIGDALSLAALYKCPILCSKEVLDMAAIEMDDDGTMTEDQVEENHKDRSYSSVISVENLEKMLDKAIQNEEYEIASQLRDRILELKQKSN